MPRTIRAGKPRSARAAPATPAPLIGRALPVASRCASATCRSARRWGPSRPCFGRDRVDPGRSRVLGLVDGVADARNPAARLDPGTDSVRSRPGEVVVAGRHDGLEEHGRVLDDAEEDGARPQEARGDRALERLRRTGVRQPGREDRRRQAVLRKRDEHGVEEHRLLGRRRAAAHEQVRELRERDLAHQVVRQVETADRDRIGVDRADVGVEPVAIAHPALLTRPSKSISAPVRSRGSSCLAIRPVGVCGSSATASR